MILPCLGQIGKQYRDEVVASDWRIGFRRVDYRAHAGHALVAAHLLPGRDAMETVAHGLGPHAARASLRLLIVLILASLLAWPGGCAQQGGRYAPPAGTPTVRVLLLENRQQVHLSATAMPTIHLGADCAGQQLQFPPGSSVPISLTPAGWQIGTAQLGRGELLLEQSVDGSVRIDKRAYHGRYRFIPVPGGRFNVINDVDLEGYLQGVLRSELFPNWHDEAYKAQAIVARTYAMYEARTDGAGRPYDVFCDQRSQVYGGIDAETPRSREATAATAGIVVAYGSAGREVIFKAYFSSCCGGISQSAADAFGDDDLPPLTDQNRGKCCSDSPKFNWGPIAISKAELTRRLRAWGVWRKQPFKDIAPIARFDIAQTSRLGRPTRFMVTDARGYRYSIRAEDLREAINTDAKPNGVKVFSSFFKPVDRGPDILFTEGHGYGHGVGMCQWCAEHEAGQGWNDEAIVLNAFPGAKLVRAY
jgi:stage II sporulation protein D